MIRDTSYKSPGAPSTAALLANASGRPDFLILNTTPSPPPRKRGERLPRLHRLARNDIQVMCHREACPEGNEGTKGFRGDLRDFSLAAQNDRLSAIPEKSWLPERDNRIPPLPVTYQGQAPSGLPPYTGHSLTGERLMGERLLDGSQPFSGDYLIEPNPDTVALQPLPSRRGRESSSGSTPPLNPLVTPRVPFRVDNDPGSPRCRIKSSMTVQDKEGKRLPQSLTLFRNDKQRKTLKEAHILRAEGRI
ncbi:hypothetical protein MNBD_NITROSPINAE04-847 [hydrothermal vent metagenome]|uniref:Uncharacterized protein n=1 Tax=hydrothermal vent metagenome TaxID=652676 RepID=A0A3B1BR26_9ZZZZ